MKSMNFKVLDKVLVLVHTAENPNDEEWMSYVREIQRQGKDLLPQIVLTEGGRPNTVQRKALTDVLAGRSVKVAVLSEQAMVRGVVTAIGWFNKDIKAFSPSNLSPAMSYLGLSEAHRFVIEGSLSFLRGNLAKAA